MVKSVKYKQTIRQSRCLTEQTRAAEAGVWRTVVINAVYEAHPHLGVIVGHQDDVEQLLAVWVQLPQPRVDLHQRLLSGRDQKGRRLRQVWTYINNCLIPRASSAEDGDEAGLEPSKATGQNLLHDVGNRMIRRARPSPLRRPWSTKTPARKFGLVATGWRAPVQSHACIQVYQGASPSTPTGMLLVIFRG